MTAKRVVSMQSLDDFLRSYSFESLAAAARARGIASTGWNKMKIIQALPASLYDGDVIAELLSRLTPVERTVLDRIVLLGGEVLTASIRHQLGSEGIIDAPAFQRPFSLEEPTEQSSSRFETIIKRLGLFGLVFGVNTGPYRQQIDLGTTGQYLVIPDGVLKHIPVPSIPVETVSEPREQEKGDGSAMLRDVYALLSLLRDEPVSLTARGQIAKRDLVRIDAALRVHEDMGHVKSEWDLGRLPLLRALAEDLKLLTSGVDGLKIGNNVLAFLAQPAATRQRRLFDAYTRTKRWSELTRIRNIAISPRAAMTGPKIAAARKTVLAELATLPAEVWLPVDHLLERIWTLTFEFLVPRNWDYSHYYYGSSYYSDPDPYIGSNALGLTFQSRTSQPVGWSEIEGGFIWGVLDALNWLGAIDIGPTEVAWAFRINPAGQKLLHGEAPPAILRQPNVIVQPNFQVLAFEPTGEDVLYMLDRIAQRVRAEQVVEYYLTRDAVYRAQRAGMEASEIIAFLDRVSSTPLPQNVRRSLEEWGAGHERIAVRRGVAALEVANARALDALYADATMTPLLGRRVAPTLALIPAANLQRIYLHLLEDDHYPLPATTEGDDASGGKYLTIDEDGGVHFLHDVPSMYVLAALRPLTDEVEPGLYRLTPERVASAVGVWRDGSVTTSDDIIALLQRLHAGPLPDSVMKLIRRWTKAWGRGEIRETTLLEVETMEIMAALLDDPEIGPHLHPLPGNPVVATIAREEADLVQSALAMLGMEVHVPVATIQVSK